MSDKVMIDPDVPLGVQLRDTRKRLGWTQEMVAKALGYEHHSVISRKEQEALKGRIRTTKRDVMALLHVEHCEK